jgi:hypothetical protein
MTADWITAFVAAAAAAEQIEGQANELSEQAARGLLRWCLNGSTGTGDAGTAAGGASFQLQCVRCGSSFQHTPPTWDSGGSYLDYLFACPPCKSALKNVFGTPASPGRPELPAREQRVRRIRGLSHRLSAIRQGVRPDAPSMQRPSSGRPSSSAPSMPKPGPR